MITDTWFFDNIKLSYRAINQALYHNRAYRDYESDELIGTAYEAFVFSRGRWADGEGRSFVTYYFNCAKWYVKRFITFDSEHRRRSNIRHNRASEDSWLMDCAMYHDRKHRFYRLPAKNDHAVEQMFMLFNEDATKLRTSLMEGLTEHQKDAVVGIVIEGKGLRTLALERNISHQAVHHNLCGGLEKMKRKAATLQSACDLFGIVPETLPLQRANAHQSKEV